MIKQEMRQKESTCFVSLWPVKLNISAYGVAPKKVKLKYGLKLSWNFTSRQRTPNSNTGAVWKKVDWWKIQPFTSLISESKPY